MRGQKFGIGIYKDNPMTPHDWFTIGWNDGNIEIIGHGKDDVTLSTKVKESYVKNVVKNPEPYVENPAKLDLDWLKSRLN